MSAHQHHTEPGAVSWLHPLEGCSGPKPTAFTYPFCYTPHPWCVRAAHVVQQKLDAMQVTEGKMYGVLVAEAEEGNSRDKIEDKEEGRAGLVFLAAYSGQLNGSYAHPWFVPPVVDYLAPDSHFQQEQAAIMALGRQADALRASDEVSRLRQRLAALKQEREEAVAAARQAYAEGKARRAGQARTPELTRESQHQKADIQRAKQLHREEMAAIEEQLGQHKSRVHALLVQRKQRSEALQQWLFEQFDFVNARGERKNLKEIFGGQADPPPCPSLVGRGVVTDAPGGRQPSTETTASAQIHPTPLPTREGQGGGSPAGGSAEGRQASTETTASAQIHPTPLPTREGQGSGSPREGQGGGSIPSGAGECCGPKLLQAAYLLGLRPLAMAEFWWGPSSPTHYRQPGVFFPACHSKCRPILGHMLQGLTVEPDPAIHYNNVHTRVRVMWEDEHLAVVYKPEGMCSIPGRSDQVNLFDEALRLWPGIEGSIIVHRLDQDTSGVMVVAKNARVHRALAMQFERREVSKRYVALLEAGSRTLSVGQTGMIDLPLGPDLADMPRRHVDPLLGKAAQTRYEVLDAEERCGRPVVRVAFYPQTGRTHQLRVHASAPEGLGMPIVGDRLYGHVADRLYLHAEMLSFVHPVSREPMTFHAPVPF